VAELRRLVHALQEPAAQRERRLWWSRFRRRHQASARRSHGARRARQAPLRTSPIPQPIQLPGLPALTDVLWEQLHALLPPQKPLTGRPAVDHRLIVEGMRLRRAHQFLVARAARAVRSLVHDLQPLPTLVQRGAVGTHPAGPASGRSSVCFLRLMFVTVTVALGGHCKQAGDERHLSHEISFVHPLHLPFADHVHDLVSLQRVPCRFRREEA
jgi:hypothetical protein